jgi:hypothetical protein
VPDSPDRETARPLTTLGGVEPHYLPQYHQISTEERTALGFRSMIRRIAFFAPEREVEFRDPTTSNPIQTLTTGPEARG